MPTDNAATFEFCQVMTTCSSRAEEECVSSRSNRGPAAARMRGYIHRYDRYL